MMKITRLQSENVKRIVAVDITPDGNVITIGGKNGAGKSSVLDSIAYALGGKQLIPAEPIRRGEHEAKIVVDVGDIIITRKFRRPVISWGCAFEGHSLFGHAGAHDKRCDPMYGEVVSSIEVSSRDGAKYPSPQAMLDKLLGELTFDPLEFSRFKPKNQRETLSSLLGLNTEDIDNARAELVTKRGLLKSRANTFEAQLKGLPRHINIPEDEQSTDELRAQLSSANEKHAALTTAKALLQTRLDRVDILKEQQAAAQKELALAEARVNAMKTQLETLDSRLSETADLIKSAEEAVALAEKDVPDTTALSTELEAIEMTNIRVRENKKHLEMSAAYKAVLDEVDQTAEAIKKLDEARVKRLTEAKYPVEGLGLSDDGVTFNGLPLEQAAMSDQVRISVAIGLALNPMLKVLLVRNGNLLDSHSRQMLAEQAAAADAQIWMEYVSETKDGVSVMIEDGHTV